MDVIGGGLDIDDIDLGVLGGVWWPIPLRLDKCVDLRRLVPKHIRMSNSVTLESSTKLHCPLNLSASRSASHSCHTGFVQVLGSSPIGPPFLSSDQPQQAHRAYRR